MARVITVPWWHHLRQDFLALQAHTLTNLTFMRLLSVISVLRASIVMVSMRSCDLFKIPAVRFLMSLTFFLFWEKLGWWWNMWVGRAQCLIESDEKHRTDLVWFVCSTVWCWLAPLFSTWESIFQVENPNRQTLAHLLTTALLAQSFGHSMGVRMAHIIHLTANLTDLLVLYACRVRLACKSNILFEFDNFKPTS